MGIWFICLFLKKQLQRKPDKYTHDWLALEQEGYLLNYYLASATEELHFPNKNLYLPFKTVSDSSEKMVTRSQHHCFKTPLDKQIKLKSPIQYY